MFMIPANQISATACIELCLGASLPLAAVQGATCYCVSDLVRPSQVESDACITPCPANPAQHCGDDTNAYYSIYDTG